MCRSDSKSKKINKAKYKGYSIFSKMFTDDSPEERIKIWKRVADYIAMNLESDKCKSDLESFKNLVMKKSEEFELNEYGMFLELGKISELTMNNKLEND